MVDERDGAWKSFDGMLLLDCPWKPPAARVRTVNNEVRSVADRSEHTSVCAEAGSASAIEKLEAHLKLAEYSSEAVRKMSNLLKFNNEQCGYLADKLKVVIGSAKLFLEYLSRAKLDGAPSFVVSSRPSEFIFNLLVTSAKQIESFVQDCCKDEWIRAAMFLTTVSQFDVLLLGSNLEYCRLFLSYYDAATRCRPSFNVYEAEAEIVEMKALADVKTLIEKVMLEHNSLHGPNRDLASYLLQRLLKVETNTATDSDDGTSLGAGILGSKKDELIENASFLNKGHLESQCQVLENYTNITLDYACDDDACDSDHSKSLWGLPECIFNKQACISPWIQFGVCAFFLPGLPSFGILELLTVFGNKPLEDGYGNYIANCDLETLDILQPIYLEDCEGLQDCNGCLFAFNLMLPLKESGAYVSVHETHQVFGSGISTWGYKIKWFTTPKLQGQASKCKVDEYHGSFMEEDHNSSFFDGPLVVEDMALTKWLKQGWTTIGQWYAFEGNFGKCLESNQGQADNFGHYLIQPWDDADPCGSKDPHQSKQINRASVIRSKEPVSAKKSGPTPVALIRQSSLSRSQTPLEKYFVMCKGQSYFGISMNIFQGSPQELTEAQKCELLEKIIFLDFLKVKNKEVKKLLTTFQDCHVACYEISIQSMVKDGNIANDATNADSKLAEFDPKFDAIRPSEVARVEPELVTDGSMANVECMTLDVAHIGGNMSILKEFLDDGGMSEDAHICGKMANVRELLNDGGMIEDVALIGGNMDDPKFDAIRPSEVARVEPELVTDGSMANVECMTLDVAHIGGNMSILKEFLDDGGMSEDAHICGKMANVRELLNDGGMIEDVALIGGNMDDPKFDAIRPSEVARVEPELVTDGSMANVECMTLDVAHIGGNMSNVKELLDDGGMSEDAHICGKMANVKELLDDGGMTEDAHICGKMANVRELLNDGGMIEDVALIDDNMNVVQFCNSAVEDMKCKVQIQCISAGKGANVSSQSDEKTQASQLSKRKFSKCSLDQEVSSRKSSHVRSLSWSVEEKEAFLKLKVEALQVVEGSHWDFISQGLWERYGFKRGHRSCQALWDTMMKQFKTIQSSLESSKSDHQQWVSYWKMNDYQRFENNLPKVFHFEWFEMMEDILATQKELLVKKSRGMSVQKGLGDEESSHPHPAHSSFDEQQFPGKKPCMNNVAEMSSPKYDGKQTDLMSVLPQLVKQLVKDTLSSSKKRTVATIMDDDLAFGSTTGLKKLKSSTFESSTLQNLEQDYQNKLLAIQEKRQALDLEEEQIKLQRVGRRRNKGHTKRNPLVG